MSQTETPTSFFYKAIDPNTNTLTRNAKATISWFTLQPQFCESITTLMFQQLELNQNKTLIKDLAIISYTIRTGDPSFRAFAKKQKSILRRLAKHSNQEISRHAKEVIKLIDDNSFYEEAVFNAAPVHDYLVSIKSDQNVQMMVIKLPKGLGEKASASSLRTDPNQPITLERSSSSPFFSSKDPETNDYKEVNLLEKQGFDTSLPPKLPKNQSILSPTNVKMTKAYRVKRSAYSTSTLDNSIQDLSATSDESGFKQPNKMKLLFKFGSKKNNEYQNLNSGED